jgi:hypothetical protein
MSQSDTIAPEAWSRFATARPMPWAPPVITAVCPSTSYRFISSPLPQRGDHRAGLRDQRHVPRRMDDAAPAIIVTTPRLLSTPVRAACAIGMCV